MKNKESFNLPILARIMLPGVLPSEASYEEIIVKEEIKKKVLLSISEIEKYEVVTNGKVISWNAEGDIHELSVLFRPIEKKFIEKSLKDRLIALNEEKKVTSVFIEFCNVFGVKI
jgi:hypothetical protein